MTVSKTAGPLGICFAPETLPGPLGVGFNFNSKDSAGPLGINDWAGFMARLSLTDAEAGVASGACACQRDMTLDELCRVFNHQSRKRCGIFLPHINATFRNYGLNTCLRRAHFLAQVGHESGELTYTAEVLPKGKHEADVYDGYKGRGLIQLTYQRNYSHYGQAVDHDFTGAHRSDLQEPKWATDSAGWYWTSGTAVDLNGLADKNDLLAITALINGAFNGFQDRRELLVRAKAVFDPDHCITVHACLVEFLAFENSAVYDNRHQSLAWGLWNDPKSGKKGVVANPEAKKAGYKRYLELLAEWTRAGNKEKPRFGLSIEKMKSMAEAGSQ